MNGFRRITAGGAAALATLALTAVPASAADYAWQDGISQQVSFLGVGNLVGSVQSYVGWYAEADSSPYKIATGNYPQTGDVFYVHAVVAIVGNPWAGYEVSQVDLQLPTGTDLAVSAETPVQCALTVGSTTYNSTNDPSMACPKNPQHGTGIHKDISLGFRRIVSYGIFDIQIPVRATVPLNGLNADSTLSAYSDAVAGDTTPSTHVWVPLKQVTISYPAAPATDITQTSARLHTTVASHYMTGPVYFDVGPTTSYGTTKDAYDIPSGGDVYDVWEDFTGLAPGTTYHFRVRFVTNGQTFTGADQTFTTAPAVGTKTTTTPTTSTTPTTTTTTTPTPPRPTPDRTAPALTKLTLTPARFKAPKGATVRYRLSEAGTVTFTVNKRDRKGKWLSVRGSFSDVATAGMNSCRFTGRMRGSTLKPGSYQLVATARDKAGNTSKPVKVTFTIVR